MTAIGMLSWQYLGMRADDPAMVEGKQCLLEQTCPTTAAATRIIGITRRK